MEKQNLSKSKQLLKIFSLAIPVSLAQAGNIVANMIDAAMLGRYDPDHMIASSMGFQVFIIPFILFIGMSIGLTALTAHTIGKQEKPSSFFTALILYFGLAIIICGVLYVSSFFLNYFHPDPNIVNLARNYVIVMGISVLPVSIFLSFKQYLEGYGLTLMATIVSLLTNIINIGLNYVLIYGNFGFSPMGIDGAAYATLLARISGIPLILLAIYSFKTYRHVFTGISWVFYKEKAVELIKIGSPIAIQMLVEVTAFALAGIMSGFIGNSEQGAHHISLQLAALTYLLASGFGSAATVLAGQYLGENNKKMISQFVTLIFIVIIIYEILSAATFWLFSSDLPLLFLNKEEREIILISSMLLKFAAVFQIPDGIQNLLQGILRGLQDVKVPTYISISAHWTVTLVLAYFLSFHFGFGVKGIWIGFIAGLSVAAVLLFTRLRIILKRIS